MSLLICSTLFHALTIPVSTHHKLTRNCWEFLWNWKLNWKRRRWSPKHTRIYAKTLCLAQTFKWFKVYLSNKNIVLYFTYAQHSVSSHSNFLIRQFSSTLYNSMLWFCFEGNHIRETMSSSLLFMDKQATEWTNERTLFKSERNFCFAFLLTF